MEARAGTTETLGSLPDPGVPSSSGDMVPPFVSPLHEKKHVIASVRRRGKTVSPGPWCRCPDDLLMILYLPISNL
jgi:hypothetical protein